MVQDGDIDWVEGDGRVAVLWVEGVCSEVDVIGVGGVGFGL